MDKLDIRHLNLNSSMRYTPLTEADPFAYNAENGEALFFFELDESQRGNFEPDKDTLFGTLVFCGKAVSSKAAGDYIKQAGTFGDFLELPAGSYLFAQKRELLNRDDIIDMAVEIQAEGLWQRLKLKSGLYLRYLFEDGNMVTQLFRPYTE